MNTNTDVLESKNAAADEPYLTLPMGPHGVVDLFRRPDDMVLIDMGLSKKPGRHVRDAVLKSIGEGDGTFESITETDDKMFIVATVPAEVAQNALSETMRELVDPPPSAEFLLSSDALRMRERGELPKCPQLSPA